MQSPLASVRKNLAYVFVIFGVIWLVLAYLNGSGLTLWPAAACLVAAVFIKLRPNSGLTNAWGPAASILGLVLCGYQVYQAIPLLTGAFVVVASVSLVVFLLLGLGHAYLAYASRSQPQVK